MRASTFALAGILVAVVAARADTPTGGERRNFVSCPIVRDTATVPCWLAESGGELYYLGIQTDISADFDPPYLGHRVLVEGVVKRDAERICGGIVLEPVNASPLPAADAACNTILPADDRYTVPFAPRPPGPSGGRLAFQPPPGAQAARPPREGQQEFVLHYDFDAPIMGRHSGLLTEIFDYARSQPGRRVTVDGRRGATRLDDGTVLTERAEIAELRAREVATLLGNAGIDPQSIRVRWSAEVEPPDGDADWRSRRVDVRIQ
jgi:outer membrane protein OmpA-like peptidoglycan-associated protein